MDFTVLSYKPMISAIADVFASGAFRAAYVDGPPGVGKTDMASYIQQRMSLKHRYILKPGHHEPFEFYLPVPNRETQAVDFYPALDLLPPQDLKGGCLMVLDEIADAMTPIQNLCCQLIYEGGLHFYRAPEDTFFLLTGNRVADRSGANRIIAKLANRSARFTLQPTVDEWFDYGVNKGMAPSVLAFIKLLGNDPVNPNDRKKDAGGYVGTYFNSFDPSDPAQSIKPVFSSSRSLEALSRLINWIDANNPRMSDSDVLARAAALVGSPVASKYVPFRSEALAMPNPDDIAAGKKVAYPKKSGVLWTLTISLVSRATKANIENIYNWLSSGSNREFAILFVKQCFDTKATSLISPAFNKILQEPDVKQALNAS